MMILPTAISENSLNNYQTKPSALDSSVEKEGHAKTNNPTEAVALPKQAVDTVTISDAARQVEKHTLGGASTEYYEQFMPTYEGFSATAIASGVSDPGLETFSAGKTFGEVATSARASLNKNYEKLDAIGKPHIVGQTPPKDINSLFGELDRRALYAVSSNEGGLFTKDEQEMANSKMYQQLGLAVGLYNGPPNEESKFINPFLDDKTQQYKAGIQFLDRVGNEEKGGSVQYAFQRAALQEAYESTSREQGKTPEDFNTDDPLVNLILAARKSVGGDYHRGWTAGPIRDADDLRRQSWFEGFGDRLDQVIQETHDLYLPKSV